MELCLTALLLQIFAAGVQDPNCLRVYKRRPGAAFFLRLAASTIVVALSNGGWIMKIINLVGVLGVASVAMFTFACGAESTAEDLGVTQQAFNNTLAPPAGYPNTALPFDMGTTRLYSNGDWDHPGIFSPRLFSTMLEDAGWFFGAECAFGNAFGNFHDIVIGISAREFPHRPHSAKCFSSSRSVTGAPSYRYLSRRNAAGAINDSGGDLSWNWDPGAIKADCGWHQVVTGVAQTEGGEIDGIACTSAAVTSARTQQTCKTLKYDNVNHCPAGGCGADWAPGYFKNQCASTQYIKGVSKTSGPGTIGEISAILCCNW